MRVCVRPIPGWLSKAMYRVADALERYAPDGVEIVEDPADADLQVLHVIGPGVRDRWLRAPDYAVIQYCLDAGHVNGRNLEFGGDMTRFWHPLWEGRVVWSYYDLAGVAPPSTTVLTMPLGVDPVFRWPDEPRQRRGIMTSGFVSGSGAEPIWEVAVAAGRVGIPVVHIGPPADDIKGMGPLPEGADWTARPGISDEELRDVYWSVEWVAGLRHVEGYEMPVTEGLACGARPIVFDRPEMRQWYAGRALFLPELSGDELIECLTDHLDPEGGWVPRVWREESDTVLARFNWARVTSRFWHAVLKYRERRADDE